MQKQFCELLSIKPQEVSIAAMNTPEQEAKSEKAYQRAMAIIDQSWLDAGMTREELDQEKRLLELYDILLASGRSEAELNAEWDHKTGAEILCMYAAPSKLPAVTPQEWDTFAASIQNTFHSVNAVPAVLAETR